MIMKKLFYFLAAVAVVAVACSKEAVDNTDENTNVAGEKYTLFAEFPQFIDADTKAGVDDSGVFSWTAGDEINVALYSTAAATYIYKVFTCTDASTGKFEYLGEGVIPSDYHPHAAYYPKDYTGNPSNQSFNSPEDAAKGFQMEATVSGGKLIFAHENAMMKVTVNGVPSFAEQLVVGGAKVNLSLSATSDITVYVPVKAAASAKLAVQVLDGTGSGANEIITKQTTNAVKIDAANFYELPALEVGTVITLNDAASKGKNRIKVWEIGGSNNYIFTASNSYPGKLCSKDGVYYVVLNPYNASWATTGKNVGVSYDNNDSDASACTTQIYLRNIDFTTMASGALQADYRIFPHGTTTANHLYAEPLGTGTYDTPENITFHISQDGTQWSTLKWFADNGTEKPSGNWPGSAVTSNQFTIPASKVYGKSTTLVIHNGGGNNYDQTKDLVVDCTSSPNNHLSEVSITLNSTWDTGGQNKRNITWSSTTFADEIMDYPLGNGSGTAFTCPASLDVTKYIQISKEYSDQTLTLSFNNNGTLVKSWGDLKINRDFDYGF